MLDFLVNALLLGFSEEVPCWKDSLSTVRLLCEMNRDLCLGKFGQSICTDAMAYDIMFTKLTEHFTHCSQGI